MHLNKLCLLYFCVLLCVSDVAMSHLGRGNLVIGGHAAIHNPAKWQRGYTRLWTSRVTWARAAAAAPRATPAGRAASRGQAPRRCGRTCSQQSGSAVCSRA